MGKIFLLDCTLRDGGYINDWKFGEHAIKDICKKLSHAGVEAIEVGFIKGDRFSLDRTMFPNVECIAELIKPKSPSIIYVGMSDMSAPVPIERIVPFDGTSVDAIRVIFKKNRIAEGYEYCRRVKALGYKVFVQFVGTDNYSDAEFIAAIEKFNALEPDAVYVVDSFGLMKKKHFMRLIQLADNNLVEKTALGYHSHNNLQQALSNAEAFAEFHTARDKFMDATAFGMGRGAGNLNLELFAAYLNENFGARYDLEPIIDIVSDHLDAIYEKNPWGYSMPLYLSAANGCHPNYPIYYSANHHLTLRELADLIKSIEPEERKNYSAAKAEHYYEQFMLCRSQPSEKIIADHADIETDFNQLSDKLKGRDVLLIGPGGNIHRQHSRVEAVIKTENPVAIAVNYAPQDIAVDYIFLTNAKRYTQLRYDLPENINANAEIIATSNVTNIDGKFDYVLDYNSLIDRSTEIVDNSLVMLLKTMIKIGVRKVFLAGFDGYSKRADNYFDMSREYSFVKSKAEYLNRYVCDFLETLDGTIEVKFVTDSRYKQSEGGNTMNKFDVDRSTKTGGPSK